MNLFLKVLNKVHNYILQLFLITKLNKVKPAKNNYLSLIVFSKDRPLQLQAFIESCDIFFKNYDRLYLVYNYSDKDYKSAYDQIVIKYDKIIAIDENKYSSFKTALSFVLNSLSTQKFMFFVDDIMFTDYINASNFANVDLKNAIISLRLGLNLNYSYVVKEKMNLPKFSNTNNFIEWNWNESEYDWAYPLSLDGNMYLVEEFKILIKHLNFKSPNTLEDSLQIIKKYFGKRKGLCFEKSKLFNNPCNKVQSDNNNYHGSLHQDDLLKLWQEGFRINPLNYQNYNNISVHEEVTLNFK
jgi:hypothetical protein